MKTAQDYPVGIDYGYTGSPYSKVRPHRGRDLLTPNKTPLQIGSDVIALTGNSGSFNGMTYGYHLHIQAGTDKGVQNTINPDPHAFKGGVVVTTGTGKEWGNFVTVKTTSGVYVAYCHLSEIRCKVGDIIGDNMTSRDTVGLMIRHLLYREPTKADFDLFTPLSPEQAFRAIGSTDERNAVIVQRLEALKALNGQMPNTTILKKGIYEVK